VDPASTLVIVSGYGIGVAYLTNAVIRGFAESGKPWSMALSTASSLSAV
jgi:hypothetical protein